MEKTRKLRWLSVLVAVCMMIMIIPSFDALAISCRKEGFDKSLYSGKLTDSISQNVAIIATSQDGRNRADFGYTENWCDEFVADCLELAGAGSISPHGGLVSDYYSKLSKNGAVVVSASNARVGDIAFSYSSSKGRFDHVEIIYKIADGVIYTVGGNIYGVSGYDCTGGVCWKRSKSGMNYFTINTILHPNYESLGDVTPEQDTTDYTDVPAGTYYFKNKSTGTYMSVDSATAANGQNVSVAAKKETTAFQFKITGGLEHYFHSTLNTDYVVNPYSDNPSSGTNVTLYKKDNSGTQIWKFEAVSGGYLIHLKYNPSCVLTANGSNVQLATNTGAANQIWTLEDATATPEPEPEQATLSSIAINPDSIGTIYEDGSQMDTSGLTLTATYSDGTTAQISSGYSITRPSLATTGTKTLTVTYEGKTATLDVTVQDLFVGNGAASNPYLITTDEDLKNLANMVNNTAANPCYGTAYYQQTADIDLSLYDWTPIGCYYVDSVSTTTTNKAAFNGTYDGNYHTVTGLKVSVSRSYAGLFGRGNANAEIKNLAIEGTVKAADNYAGGVVGALCWGAKVSGCSFTGTVNAPYNVGGITGIVHQGGYIENCYANAEITATDTTWGFAGGIAGYTRTGSTNSTCAPVVVSNCYFVGKTTGNALENGITCGVEQLEGTYQPTLTISNCYYLNSASTGAAQTGCMGLISSQLKTVAADLGSPFANNPYSTLNDGYPVFEWQLVIEGDVNTDGTVSVLDVVALQKYLLTTVSLNADQCKNADMYNDDIVDAYDLAILKRVLLSK